MKRLFPIIALVLCALPVSSQTQQDGITIPANISHPFVYWNSSRTAAAAAWASKVHYVPITQISIGMGDPLDAAFACYVLGNSQSCSAAVNWTMSASMGSCGGTDDMLRWEAGNVGVVYDWAYSTLTPSQQSTLSTNWEACENQQNLFEQISLYPTNYETYLPTNNYFHGDLRNNVLFGISMFYDNPNAPAQLLDAGIGAVGGPASGSFINALEDFAKPGGYGYALPFVESPGQYGRYPENYAAIWIPALHLLGRDINQETTAYKAAVLVNIYDSIYTTTYRGCQEYISWSDDQYWYYGCTAGGGTSHNGYANGSSWTPSNGGGAMMATEFYGDFMQTMVNEESQTNIGKYARQWLNTVKPSVGPAFASLDANPAPLSFSNLPLDYCSGTGVCWSNAVGWYTNGSERAWFAGNALVSAAGGSPHRHAEAGSFQVWRAGIPIARETVGYAGETIAGYRGQGTVNVSSAFAHNVLLFNHHGANTPDNGNSEGMARTLRLDTEPGYFYEATDLTAAYNTAGQSQSNTAVSGYVREFVNFRSLPAIVTLDRATGHTSSTPITYLGHCETKPTVTTAGAYTYADCIDKGQQARWTFLEPAHPTITVVNELTNGASCVKPSCQYRIEAENTNPGNALSYFVVLVQFGQSGNNFAAFSPTLQDSEPSNPSSGTFTVTLDGQDGLVFQKGATSRAGTIMVAGTQSALSPGVATMAVTDNGPVWTSASVATATSVAVSPSTATAPLGAVQQYIATCTYTDGTSSDCTAIVTWSISNPSVATVSNSGLLESVAMGTTTVTATLDGVVETVNLAVMNPALTSILVTPSTTSIAAQTGTESYTATCIYSNLVTSDCTSNVNWTSSNVNAATITSTGVATGLATGGVLISASSGNVAGSSTLTVTPPPGTQWILIEGGNVYSQERGQYGSLGVSAPANAPGGRQEAAAWTDDEGNFWLFGGKGVDSTGAEGDLDDLWEYLASTNNWAWMGGITTASDASYSSSVAALAGSFPGARAESASWVDLASNLWLFGGQGYDSTGMNGNLNDLWMFTPSSGIWTQVSGSDTVPALNKGQTGIYGNLGVSAPGNTPGGRWGANSWTDSVGNLWLFGGVGADSIGSLGSLNDLWELNPSIDEWTWLSGSSKVGSKGGQIGQYGTLGIPDPANVPSGRSQGMSWADNNGNFWLFGGYGYDSVGNLGYLNDLWLFDPNTQEWSWIGGNSTVGCNGCGGSGVYGSVGVADSQSIPGGRMLAATWTDSNGNFWLFGGQGYDSAGTLGELNDLWEFNYSTEEWTWMNGSSIVASGNQGSETSTATSPEGRSAAVAWSSQQGDTLLFGGYSLDSNGSNGVLNDLWQYQPPVI